MPRRTLQFDNLDAAVADARHLLVVGYGRAGDWSLGQCCGHLARWITYPLDGFPRLSIAMSGAAWVFRRTLGPAAKRKVLATGTMKAGLPTLGPSVPPHGAQDLAELVAFEAQIERLKRFTGTPHPSPLLGPLTVDELVRVTCVHAAHHLGFLVPNDQMPAP